jgi:large subunit ribosomal protein L10
MIGESNDMSKVIKQMEMTALRESFGNVRDLVVLSIKGLNCVHDGQFRAALRKKKVRLKVVKNSLTRKVFGEIGLKVPDDSPFWTGPTAMAWGGDSIAELSQAIDGELKGAKTATLYKDKIVVKGAIADGLPVSFDKALKMPTRAEAIARVVMLALAPASQLVGQIKAAGANLASQIKTLSEKKDEAAAPAEAPAAPPA